MIDVAGDFWTLLTIDTEKTIACVNAISQGDLSYVVSVDSKGEFAELQQALQRMLAYLNEVAAVARRISAGEIDTC